MGYEVLIRWMLMIWVVLGRRFQSAMARLVSGVETIRQMPAGQREYLPAISVSVALPLRRSMSENLRVREAGQRNFVGAMSYPDDLSCFQSR